LQVFQRERLNGHYGVAAFVIANTLSATPFLIMITFISGTICYFMVGLHPGFTHYLFFVLCLYANVTVVESLMMAIASIVPNFLMGIIIGAGIQVISPTTFIIDFLKAEEKLVLNLVVCTFVSGDLHAGFWILQASK